MGAMGAMGAMVAHVVGVGMMAALAVEVPLAEEMVRAAPVASVTGKVHMVMGVLGAMVMGAVVMVFWAAASVALLAVEEKNVVEEVMGSTRVIGLSAALQAALQMAPKAAPKAGPKAVMLGPHLAWAGLTAVVVVTLAENGVEVAMEETEVVRGGRKVTPLEVVATAAF